MIGEIDRSRKKVSVAGAGFSGLIAAYQLDRAGYEVTLYEAGSRAGGLISTEHLSEGLSESAAHSFLASNPVQRLCREMQIPLVSVQKESRARYILRNGKMRRVPLNPLELIATLGRASLRPRDQSRNSALSLEDWALSRLGRPALDYLLSPFTRGIFAAEPGELAVEAAFPKLNISSKSSLAGYFLRRRAVHLVARQIEPRAKMMAPLTGMGSLVSALERDLEKKLGSRFKKNTKFEARDLSSDSNIVLALPADQAAIVLASESPKLSDQLARLKYAPLISVTAFFSSYAFQTSPTGVGVLIPSVEKKRQSLGILFNSSSFPGRVTQEDQTQSFTMMLGGTQNSALLALSDEELKVIVEREFQAVLKTNRAPEALRIARWPRAIPIYGPAILDLWAEARSSWCSKPGRVIFSNYSGQVSLRGLTESAEVLAR